MIEGLSLTLYQNHLDESPTLASKILRRRGLDPEQILIGDKELILRFAKHNDIPTTYSLKEL